MAVLVVAIGLVGIAGLILASLRNGHEALLRTQVVNLVSDMQERIRANPGAGAAYDCAAYPSGPTLQGCAPSGSALGTNCTSRALAEHDLAQWQSAVRLALPTAHARPCESGVAYTAAASASEAARYRVSVSWLQRGEPLPLTYESELLLVAPVTAP